MFVPDSRLLLFKIFVIAKIQNKIPLIIFQIINVNYYNEILIIIHCSSILLGSLVLTLNCIRCP